VSDPRHAAAPAEPRAGAPIRVLWLIKGLDPGGAELLLTMLAEVRDGDGFEYEAAYLLPWKRGLVDQLEHAGVAVHCLHGGREWDLRWAGRLRRLVRERRYDIVHIHSPYVAGIARLALRSLPRKVRPRIVYTEHVPWWGYVPASRILNAATFWLDDATVAVSRAVRESIPRRRRDGVDVVVHGIDVEAVRAVGRSREEERARLGIGPDDVLIGTIAHFRPQKAYPDLLRAARLVLDAQPRATFIAVGRGPEERRIRKLHRELGLGDRFRFAGFRSDATRVLAACDIFVLASLFEGLPLALMEALALGVPVVATEVGGIPEGVTHGEEGLLVPPSRPDLLADSLTTLVRDEELRARMTAAAARRGGEFDIAVASHRVEAIYHRLWGS
ncbi:MAG TPA: glycosyltransferase, partial [Actinomycetota bacterium]|jgi:glycosyltransferase involved in cell wall biosynthesis|nr:glycosyltransferase [Actinomycetota bacterium]